MSHIRTFARIKPSTALYPEYDVRPTVLEIRTPEIFRDFGSATKFRANIRHDFKFNNVFDVSVSQDHVFDGVAREIVDGFLGGYNGTIFAYGQTGTGKTYTVEGSARQYCDRGLAPRALSMIYKSLAARSDEEISVHISYMEIYQEVAFDLLNPGARTFSPVTPLPKVSVTEGRTGFCTLRNLSVHLAASEEVAQSLLLQGQTNRKVAETPVNQRSSRSHAVFTVYLTSKRSDSDVIIRSKLHLVDLAGSERVAKTGVDGQQLTEAKSINLSLHHLETVIIALQDGNSDPQHRKRTAQSIRQLNTPSASSTRSFPGPDDTRFPRHVPYRNSLLTMVLRDSLGGNCQTAMIATVSLETHNIGETLSTCRFAQRVACIANHAMRNEEIDDQTLIVRLKKRVAELEAEIAFMRHSKEDSTPDEMMSSKLTDEDKLQCAQVVHEYLGGRLTDPVTAGITDPYKFRECLRLLKKMVLRGYFNPHSTDSTKSLEHSGAPVSYSENASKTVQILRIEHDHGDSMENGQNGATGDSHYNFNSIDHNGNSGINPRTQSMRPTEAWGDNSKPNTPQGRNRAKSPSTPQRPGTSSSMGKYKSPYERKREREIDRLSRKVNTLQDDFDTKRMELSDLQSNVEWQELDVLESGLGAKLSVTKDQISHQQAYIAQLRDTEADRALIEQEKLVEKQLRKRQAKFEKKIQEITEHKSELQNGGQTPDTPMNPSKVNIEDKFGRYRKRDGSLNTKQVFDMLKTEENKKQKAGEELEKEKIVTMSRQLEVREAATRHKLRELKQMIRQSQHEQTPNNHHQQVPNNLHQQMPNSHHQQTPNSHQQQTSTEVEEERNHGTYQEPSSFYVTQSYKSNGQNSQLKDFHQNGNSVGVEESFVNKNSPRPSSGKSVWSFSSANIPDKSFYESKSNGGKWDSGYSLRPKTADGHLKKVNLPTETFQNDSLDQSTTISSQVYLNQRQTETTNNQISTTRNQMTTNQKKNSQNQKESSADRLSLHSFSELKPESNSTDSGTVTPSEYVNGMTSGDKFVARKMGLSSKNFDATLSSMLDSEENVAYTNEYYDQFARAGKESPSHRQSRRKPPKKNSTDESKSSSMRWGPDAKKAPVSDRLTQILQDISDATYTSHTNTGSQRRSEDAFVSRLEEFQTSPARGVTHNRQKITALSEEDREVTYMSKAEAERNRIAKIRKARKAAEVIQKAWRKKRHQR